MDYSGPGNNSRNHKSISQNSSSIKSIGIKPEVVEALNSKVLKLQQKMQHFVKICMPDPSKHRKSISSPKNKISDISNDDSKKSTFQEIEKLKKITSPETSPKAQESRSKVSLKLINNSLELLTSESNPLKLNNKTKSQSQFPNSFLKELDKSRIDQVNMQKLIDLTRNVLKNIIKLCNTCPETSKIPLLVSENCLNFVKDLNKIEKKVKCVSFADDEKPHIEEPYLIRIKERYELILMQKNEKINELDLKNYELTNQLNKLKNLFIEFSHDRTLQENAILVNIVNRINRFSNSVKLVEKRTKKLAGIVRRKLKENSIVGVCMVCENLEGLLIESKNKILELEESLGKLNSCKSENSLLAFDLAKASEIQEKLNKIVKNKELELKKRVQRMVELENEKKKIKDFSELLQAELSESREQINRLNMKYDQEVNDFKHSNIIQQHRIHKLEKEKNDLSNIEKIFNKKISELEKKSESQGLEKTNSESITIENSLEAFKINWKIINH